MQARYYDPVIGRFLSKDPVTFADKMEPGYFNRYWYTMGDPVNGVDPTGTRRVPPEAVKPDSNAFEREQAFFEGTREGMTQFIEAPILMEKYRKDMVEAKTIGADKFFHCMANCEVTKKYGEAAATF